jgi:hypothetical protein
MDEHAEYAEIYQDRFEQSRMDRNIDNDNILRVHERFEAIADQDNRFEKLADPYYDDLQGETDIERGHLTSDIDEWDDAALADIYKRFKLMHDGLKEEAEDTERLVEAVVDRSVADVKADQESQQSYGPWRENYNKLIARKRSLNLFMLELE